MYLLADSAAQAGHDYMLSTCIMIPEAQLEACFSSAQYMRASWPSVVAASNSQDVAALREIAAGRHECGEILKAGIITHRLLPMGLGQGSSGLEHKSRALARSLFAETQSLAALRASLLQVVSMTTDLGTESGIAGMAGPSLKEILPPWFSDGDLQLDVDEAPAARNPQAHNFDQDEHLSDCFLPRAMAVPGLNHIVDNMCADCNRVMEGWDQWLAGFKPVVSLMHHNYLREKFIAVCIRNTRNSWMESRFQKGLPKYAEWRWGSIVAVLKKFCPCRNFCRQHGIQLLSVLAKATL